MSDSKKKTINVTDPLFCDIKMDDGYFILEIHSEKHCIRLHFERRWIRYLANYFWKVIAKEEEDIREIKKTLRGE